MERELAIVLSQTLEKRREPSRQSASSSLPYRGRGA
jgi:hypothetical protein